MLRLPLLLFRLFVGLLIMEQCAGDSSESRKCLNLSSSSHQYTAAGERGFITTRCTISLSTLLWNEWTRIKETLTIKFMLLARPGELKQASLSLISFCPIIAFITSSVINTHISRHCSHASPPLSPPPHHYLHHLPSSQSEAQNPTYIQEAGFI